jgi:hypothetical protein
MTFAASALFGFMTSVPTSNNEGSFFRADLPAIGGSEFMEGRAVAVVAISMSIELS